ncbi:MAG: YkgJ family cysteine cluster protein [Phycisphaerae bacterium]|nr:YkgJ family cysteine cluster protein [Phycisphaerae bacterium]
MASRKASKKTCDGCNAICCRHVALEIDEPETAGDFDDIRWYVLHRNVYVFVEDGDWYVAFKTKCNSLGSDNRCATYERRPRICRNYDTDNCEFHGDGDAHEHLFETPEQVEEFAQEFLRKKRAKSRARSKKKRNTRS